MDAKAKVECRVEDFSLEGARLIVSDGQVLPDPMFLIAAGKEIGFKASVAWAQANEYGVRFEKSFPVVGVKNPEYEFLMELKLQRLRS